MDQLPKFRMRTADYIAAVILINDLVLGGIGWIVHHYWHISTGWLILALGCVAVLAAMLLSWLMSNYLTKPLALIAQAIAHIAPDNEAVAAPNTNSIHLGREIVSAMAMQIYQITNATTRLTNDLEVKNIDLHNNVIAKYLPLPLIVINQDSNIVYANEAALQYVKKTEPAVLNQNINSVLDMYFKDNNTFENWLTYSRTNTVVANKKWEHVRLDLPDTQTPLFFDLAAYFSKGHPYGYETIMVLFDHTNLYSQDDTAMNYVALAVHELRTPLTLLRGYIEALEEHMSNKLTVQDSAFVKQMDAAAQQLVTFINNVLNVARINDDQFAIQLHEENWSQVLLSAINDMKLRAAVQGITIELSIEPNLPTVAVDKLGIYEVICNLIDNAIKYSAESKKIIVHSGLNNDRLVETSIQDFGVGIPESVMPNLFDKFYRSHRSRNQINGTGLGLYLSKTIISAHETNIWVNSKEGQGSTFSFTILPFARLSKNANGDQANNINNVHGWIKNHSLYRR
ncbi:MAG TPA: ATP-binding protein [Candidatus Saccharimonadales bacterium]|nr:ATP-binding protein [Candidatus Saccharimonadales bacterium]